MNSDAFFERVSQQYANDLPFVVYRKPKANVVHSFFQNNTELYVTTDFSESGFVFAPFDDKNRTVLIPSEHSESLNVEFMMSNTNEAPNHIDSKPENDRQQHINLVQKAIDTIKEQDLVKVVLSRCENVTITDNNPIEIFKRLLTNYATAFVYCWYHPKVGLWLGATPETLLKADGNRFSTMALAGTQVYKGTLDVEWQKKEIEEQQIVTNSIVRQLKQDSNVITVSKPITVKAGYLLHIQTKISGTILNKFEKMNLQLLLGGLHPTPAICGFPRATAKRFILENETYNREYYTGFLGELNLKKKQERNTNKRNVENNAYSTVKNTSELFVNLRCMKLENESAKLFIGGGITKDSVAELEWQETVNKTKTMMRAIVF